MRISDWSSDVCSSDLGEVHVVAGGTLHWLLRSMDGEPPSLPFGWRIGMRCGVRWWQGKAAARRRGRIASDGRTFAMAAKVLLTGRWPAAAPEPRLVMTVAAIGSYSPDRKSTRLNSS